jgi:hypothetical protein
MLTEAENNLLDRLTDTPLVTMIYRQNSLASQWKWW